MAIFQSTRTILRQSKVIDSQIDLILPYRKDQLDQKLIFQLTKIDNPVFEGSFSEIKILYGEGGRRIYLIGLGEEKESCRLSEVFRKLSYETEKHWSKEIQLDCERLTKEEVTKVVTGIEMANYKLGIYKSDYEDIEDKEVILISDRDISQEIIEGKYTGESINRVKTMIDAPSNQKTPQYLADWADSSAQQYNYECKIWDRNALENQGFGAILAVGDGSIHSPNLIQVSHLPNKEDTIDIGLVGKGITFDSGGLSIKPAQNLHYMKSDMGGAAVVLGIVELAARLNLKVNIIGVVAAAENAVDANSFRPGDVINSYSGKTIEIIDTDAEGRLVLADAISYIIRKHQPNRIIDLATLTGSVVRTLGFSSAGMFSKNMEMTSTLSHLGESINEKVWPLPLYDEFEVDLHSDLADIRNFSGKPIAGGSMAAKFLEAFTEEHKNWVHLDIAGMAFGASDYAKMKSATGFGLRLMLEYIKSLEQKYENQTS